MIVIAIYTLNFIHPGIFFVQRAGHRGEGTVGCGLTRILRSPRLFWLRSSCFVGPHIPSGRCRVSHLMIRLVFFHYLDPCICFVSLFGLGCCLNRIVLVLTKRTWVSSKHAKDGMLRAMGVDDHTRSNDDSISGTLDRIWSRSQQLNRCRRSKVTTRWERNSRKGVKSLSLAKS